LKKPASKKPSLKVQRRIEQIEALPAMNSALC